MLTYIYAALRTKNMIPLANPLRGLHLAFFESSKRLLDIIMLEDI
jgi:hypothetical protein